MKYAEDVVKPLKLGVIISNQEYKEDLFLTKHFVKIVIAMILKTVVGGLL